MDETLEELTARHEQELEELEQQKSAHIDAATALGKGKKAKAAIDAAERDASTWDFEISERHKEELDDLEGGANAGAEKTSAAAEAAVADDVMPAVVAKETNAEESEAARIQQKKEKAAKKREKKSSNDANVEKPKEGYTREVPSPLNLLSETSAPNSLMTPMSPTMRGCRSPSQRWQDDPVSVEDLAPATALAKPDFEIIEGIQPFSDAVQAIPRMKEIMSEVAALSIDAFQEDALAMVTRKARWKMTLLVRSEGGIPQFSLDGGPPEIDDEEEPPLIGFIIYKLKPESEAFSIAKIAVVPEHRNKGHGGRLMDWVKAQAKKQKDIKYISLCSLPDAVRFYKKIGFHPVDVKLADNCADGEELIEGQVYMEYQVRKRGHKKK